MARQSLLGIRFGRLVVIDAMRHPHALVRCDCGQTKTVSRASLRDGSTRSCGCLRRDVAKFRNYHHGECGSSLHRIWKGARTRCYNSKAPSWPRYGGRGIYMCDEWTDYTAFKEWALGAGYKRGLSLDRIDNDGPYAPNNCRWATAEIQARNTSTSIYVNYQGERLHLIEAAHRAGLLPNTLRSRIWKKWPEDMWFAPLGSYERPHKRRTKKEIEAARLAAEHSGQEPEGCRGE